MKWKMVNKQNEKSKLINKIRYFRYHRGCQQEESSKIKYTGQNHKPATSKNQAHN